MTIAIGEAPEKATRPGVGLPTAAIVVAALALVASFVWPWIEEAGRARNEEAAVAFLRDIHKMQGQFQSTRTTRGEQRFAVSFFELAAAGLLPGPAPDGPSVVRAGYAFRIGTPGDPAARYYAIARPERPGVTGHRSFYIDETGVCRASPGSAVGPAFPELR